MKSIPKKILLIGTLFLLTFGYEGSSVNAMDDSQSAIHELPKADQCSLITMDIRRLAYSLKKIFKEISLLESPVHSPSQNNKNYEQQINQYEQNMNALQEKASSLRKQINLQEQQLESCLQHNTALSEHSSLEKNTKERRN